jgi:hypothetical protein
VKEISSRKTSPLRVRVRFLASKATGSIPFTNQEQARNLRVSRVIG